VSAAYVTGMLSLEDAVAVSYHRSRLQGTTAGSGGMLAAGLSTEEALEWIGARTDVCIAAINSPSGVTLAGTHAAIDELSDRLGNEGIFARKLRVEVPYHSHLMDPILPELTEALSGLTPQSPVIPLYSTVTGAQVTGPDWNAEYWCANVRKPVLFAAATTALIDRGDRVFLEIGPHPVLSANIKEILLGKSLTGTAIPTLRRDVDDHTSLRTALADLYVAGGLDTDRAPGSSDGMPPHCQLPSHQFQRQRLWSVEEAIVDDRMGNNGARALPGDPVDSGHPEWRAELASATLPWLRDHVVADMVLLPGAAYLDAALAAARQITDRTAP
ncbi:acyltransferase domain-containing protein, partial [Mycobacterium scrofulaceum]|uniref:acyltransferase domain-containing protein n=1 Tax=Mycobacterium scrofulaceum TaxID=1783 RepID=UPI000A41D11F